MKKLFATLQKFFDGISEHNINAHAAASAFYMFMSLVPFVALLSAIIPYTGLSQDTLFEVIDRYIPEALQSIIDSVVDDIYFASGAVLPLSVLIMIWLSSRAFSCLIRGIEDICHMPKYSSYWHRSLMACVYTIAMIAIVIVILALMVFGQEIYAFVSANMPWLASATGWLLRLRFVLAFIVLTLVFLAIYLGVPHSKFKFWQLLPGAAGAGASFLLFTWLFSLYIKYGSGYSTTYGSLATIVISLLWMYWCMYIILLGAAVNEFILDSKKQ